MILGKCAFSIVVRGVVVHYFGVHMLTVFDFCLVVVFVDLKTT